MKTFYVTETRVWKVKAVDKNDAIYERHKEKGETVYLHFKKVETKNPVKTFCYRRIKYDM